MCNIIPILIEVKKVSVFQLINQFILEIPKKVTGKQCRPISDRAECRIFHWGHNNILAATGFWFLLPRNLHRVQNTTFE